MAIAAALTLAAPTPALASDDPAPDGAIAVEVVTVNGSGCPAGTAQVTPLPGNTGFRITYSDYLARAGGHSDATASRKNCQINLALHVPRSHTYAIVRVDYRGYAHLQPGAHGVEKASYYFQGQSEGVSASHSIDGPYSDDWQFTDTVSQRIYKPCGHDRNLNTNTELRVEAGASPSKVSFMAMDDTRGSINTVYHLSWKTCP